MHNKIFFTFIVGSPLIYYKTLTILRLCLLIQYKFEIQSQRGFKEKHVS